MYLIIMSTYCFTAVSISVSVIVQSHPKPPLLQFFWGAQNIIPKFLNFLFYFKEQCNYINKNIPNK